MRARAQYLIICEYIQKSNLIARLNKKTLCNLEKVFPCSDYLDLIMRRRARWCDMPRNRVFRLFRQIVHHQPKRHKSIAIIKKTIIKWLIGIFLWTNTYKKNLVWYSILWLCTHYIPIIVEKYNAKENKSIKEMRATPCR